MTGMDDRPSQAFYETSVQGSNVICKMFIVLFCYEWYALILYAPGSVIVTWVDYRCSEAGNSLGQEHSLSLF